MVRCPEHLDALLQKVMGQRFMGVWFPDFICPVDRKRFTYLKYLMAAKKIDRKEARKLMVCEAERLGGGRVDPLSTLYADMIKELVIKEVRETVEKTWFQRKAPDRKGQEAESSPPQ